METRVCKKCKKELPLEAFGKNALSKDGHIWTCKKCASRIEVPDTIYCPVCNKEQPFYKFKKAPKGKYGRSWICNDCDAGLSYNELRNLRNKVDEEHHKKRCMQRNTSKQRNFIHNMWKAAKNRAEKRGLEFTITEEDIIIPERCPILETPFIYGTKGNYKYTPSLDRIDNSKGYVKGNIMVISNLANTMKNEATLDELKKFCTNILRYSLNNGEKKLVELENKESLS